MTGSPLADVKEREVDPSRAEVLRPDDWDGAGWLFVREFTAKFVPDDLLTLSLAEEVFTNMGCSGLLGDSID